MKRIFVLLPILCFLAFLCACSSNTIGGLSEAHVDSWFESYNKASTIPYCDWTICSMNRTDDTAIVECTAISKYSLGALGMDVVNEEHVILNFALVDSDSGSQWSCGMAEGDYSSSITNVSVSSSTASTLHGEHDTWNFTEPTDSNYELRINSLKIDSDGNGNFYANLDACCDAYEYIYYGYGRSDQWSCRDFQLTNTSVKRDEICLSGVCTDDHIYTKYDLLFNNDDLGVWRDSGYSEDRETVERHFSMILTPDNITVRISDEGNELVAGCLYFSEEVSDSRS